MKWILSHLMILLCIQFTGRNVFSQPNFPEYAEKADLIYTDIENFVNAYSQLKIGSDTSQILQKFYFDKGSQGLKEFEQRHGLTSSTLKKAIHKYPEYYKRVSEFLVDIDKFKKAFVEELKALKQVHEGAVFPPTYLVVGSNRGVAQASQVGGLITIERNTSRWDKLYTLIIHELVHFQQAITLGFGEYSSMYSKKNNMLDIILREGSAEFVTYYLIRKKPKSLPNIQKFEKEEQELWARFKKDLTKQDMSFWLWNTDEEGRSVALGYTLGALICKAYYDKATNKKQALKDILSITDPEVFLNKSGYKP